MRRFKSLHDECARMFKECSDKLGATGQDITSMKEHLNGHPPRDWQHEADRTIIDVQNRVKGLPGAQDGVRSQYRGIHKESSRCDQEVANTDAKIQALHDECARMFKECSDKLGATGQDIISMKEHLNGHPPRDWHLKADQTIIDVQNRVNYFGAQHGVRSHYRGIHKE